MKTLKYKQLIFGIVGLLIVLFIVKAVCFFMVKPKITVDYVAQFNQFSRPKDYDSQKNAAPYYQKAFDAFIEMPGELRYLEPWADVNDLDKRLFGDWLDANAKAFEYYREAADKPYCWIKRIPLDSPPKMNFMIPELNSHKNFADAFIWNARVHADKGLFQAAFDNLLACYRSGRHKCRPNLQLFEQYLGLRLKHIAIESAFFILAKYEIEGNILKDFQDALWTQLNADSYVPSLDSQKFEAYDCLQRTFLDNCKGTGRWAWSAGWVQCLCGEESDLKEIKQRLYTCLFGATRTDIADKIEELIELSDAAMHETPWQIKNKNADYFDKIDKIENSHIFFVVVPIALSSENILNAYCQTRAQTDALITVLAILRYKNDTNEYPESLDELVASGYLESVPDDPYSNGSLIYRMTEDDFTLYSVGEDFADNGGKTSEDGVYKREISIAVKTPDIVYWPIRIIETKPVEYPMMMGEGMETTDAKGRF